MRFCSILHDRDAPPERGERPECLSDLNLDQVLQHLVNEREDYDLEPFFFAPLRDPATVAYRQAAVAELERSEIREAVDAFSEGMRLMRRRRRNAADTHFPYQSRRWLLKAITTYCEAVVGLGRSLRDIRVNSAAFAGLREFLAAYTSSEAFRIMFREGRRLEEELAEVRYAVEIRGDRVTVRPYEGGEDYSVEVEKTFAKFKQSDAKDYLVEFPNRGMNHVEAHILELVARLHRPLFTRLDDFCSRHRDYVHPVVARFDREVQFFLAFLDYVEPLKRAGLPFCYPQVSATSKHTDVIDGFDLALAAKLVAGGETVVCNDFRLTDRERAIVVTGPNQGGKTTFARMFGQIHYLAGLGLPVPARRAQLFLPDRIFTHFEREERVSSLRSKLEDELVRLHHLLEEATCDSLVVINEGLASTTLEDAVFLGTRVMRRMLDKGLLCVFVTFVDELASLNEATVSMVAQVDPDDPARRTFRVIRKPADGLAYAAAIAEKYGLDYRVLKRRVAS